MWCYLKQRCKKAAKHCKTGKNIYLPGVVGLKLAGPYSVGVVGPNLGSAGGVFVLNCGGPNLGGVGIGVQEVTS